MDEHEIYLARCRDCDGVNAAMVDNPDHCRDVAKDIAQCIRDLQYIERHASKTELPAWCHCHETEYEQAERKGQRALFEGDGDGK